MRLNLFGAFKKPSVTNPQTQQINHKTKTRQETKPKTDYVIISTETIPVEFYCELPTKVKEQLIKNLSGGMETYDIPSHSSPRSLNIAI